MYEILWKGSLVGHATVNKEGLFYRIDCSCNLPEAGVYRVTATDGSNTYDLGICVPDGALYSCVTRVPCKRFSGNRFAFALADGGARISVPITEGEFFHYLDKLSASRLVFANGKPEIVIDLTQDQQDNDRNPAHQRKWVQM